MTLAISKEIYVSIDVLKDRLPDYARDLKLNLSSLAAETLLSPQQRAGSQIEWPLAFFGSNQQGALFFVLFWHVSKINDSQGDGIRVTPDGRHGLAVHGRERRLQRVVPTHNCCQGSRERADVQRTTYPDCDGQIIDAGPRLELVKEPEPLLRK